MEKKYYFLAGLPRSGNTVLSSILNQNDKIYCSPLSPISQILWNYDQSLQNSENFKMNVNNNIIDVGQGIVNNYYKNIKKEIIVDREKGWAAPGNLELIKKYINKDPKIIFTVRPTIEILTSFINLLDEDSYLDEYMIRCGWTYKNYLSKNDNRCDFLMRPGGQIDLSLTCLNQVLDLNNKNNFCIIKYDSLIENPQPTMDKIYNFLEISNYKHDFNNIEKTQESFNSELGLPKNLHDIRTKINKISKDPKTVLSNYIIDKYSNDEWSKIQWGRK
jgi:sulfotransferase